MVKYDRSFLVPYLQDIVSVELLLEKLKRKYDLVYHDIQSSKRVIERYEIPEEVKAPDLNPSFNYAVSICCFFCAFVSFIFTLIFSPLFIVTSMLTLAGCLFIIKGKAETEEEQEYEKKRREYEIQKKNYEDHEGERNKARNAIEAGEKKEKLLSGQLKELCSLREQLYNVNVIPTQYRNTYTVMFLYDWFSTSRADDMDHALSMFVLEEIKDRLDNIIENQSQMILNQRMMIANQYKSLEQQRTYENMMRSKLRQMQATQEEQLCYTRMIESNTAVTAYFAAADYIRRI